MIERVADGKRRFFAAQGTVTDVLLRDRKGHQDRSPGPIKTLGSMYLESYLVEILYGA